jgi:putative endonuclease
MGYCVYILYSSKLDKYYVGRTENLEVRLQFHDNPIESRKFTAKGIPWVLKASLSCRSLEHSIKLEQFIKRMKSRKFIESLITDPMLRNDIINKTST